MAARSSARPGARSTRVDKTGIRPGRPTKRPVLTPNPARPGWLRSYLREHRRTFGDCVIRLISTPYATAMTVLVIAIALVLPGLFALTASNLQTLGPNIEDTARLTLFLSDGVNEQEGLALSEDLLTEHELEAAEYVSRAAALAEFQTQSGFGELLEQLEENPLPASITITPQQHNRDQVQQLVAQLQARTEVESVQVDMVWMQRLRAFQGLLSRISLLLALVLGLAVLFIVGNTIRLAIDNRRREIEVVRLVGGTASYIARPFLYSGLLLGIAGASLACVLILIIQLILSPEIDNILSLYGSNEALQGLSVSAALWLIALGGFLGWLGAALSTAARLYASPP